MTKNKDKNQAFSVASSITKELESKLKALKIKLAEEPKNIKTSEELVAHYEPFLQELEEGVCNLEARYRVGGFIDCFFETLDGAYDDKNIQDYIKMLVSLINSKPGFFYSDLHTDVINCVNSYIASSNTKHLKIEMSSTVSTNKIIEITKKISNKKATSSLSNA